MNVLIVVDYQVDKVTGIFKNKTYEENEWPIVSIIRDYLENDYPVYYTIEENEKDYDATLKSKIIDTPYCIKNTYGAELYGEVKVYLKEYGIACPKSQFGSTSLIRKLRGQNTKLLEQSKTGIERVEILGNFMEYDIMTIAIMCRSALPEANIVVNGRLTGYMNIERAKIALEAMRMVGVKVR